MSHDNGSIAKLHLVQVTRRGRAVTATVQQYQFLQASDSCCYCNYCAAVIPDVVSSVNFAVINKLPLAVRGGGGSWVSYLHRHLPCLPYLSIQGFS